jgi:hypothetical protein
MKSMIREKHYSKSASFVTVNLCRFTRQISYALSELKKDIEAGLLIYPESERDALRAATHFAVFVVHNKSKPKFAELPQDVL